MAKDELRGVVPRLDDKFSSSVETDRLDAQFELATAALVSGLTNCATIASALAFPTSISPLPAWVSPKENIRSGMLCTTRTIVTHGPSRKRFAPSIFN